MNDIQLFSNPQFGEIRTAVSESGEPMFCAADLCKALGYANPRDAVAKHVSEDDVTKRDIIDSLGRTQSASFVNESGLYSIIFGSKLDSAKGFKRWVTSEVLPAIRKTGGYMAAREGDTDEMLMARALLVAKEAIDRKNRQIAEQKQVMEVQGEQIAALNAACDEMRPKVNYYDRILANPSLILTTSIALDYGMTAIKFNRLLHEMKIQRRVGKQWIPCTRYISEGYAHTEPFEIRTDHGSKFVQTTKWTQKGRIFLYEALKKRGILPLIETA